MGGKENLSHIRESLKEALPHTTERQRYESGLHSVENKPTPGALLRCQV